MQCHGVFASFPLPSSFVEVDMQVLDFRIVRVLPPKGMAHFPVFDLLLLPASVCFVVVRKWGKEDISIV